MFKKGQRVRWNDPGINDYDYKDRDAVLNRIFRIQWVDNENGMAYIVEEGGPSEAEVFTNELEAMVDTNELEAL